MVQFKHDPQLVTLAGVDGAGKSTILNALQSTYDANYIKEPFNQHYIDLIKSTDDVFKQIDYFAMDRFNLYKDIEFPLSKTIVSDRSFICSLVYQSLELEDKYHWPPFSAIKQVYDQQMAIVPPSLVIYIHAEPSVIHRRLSARGEDHYLTLDQINAIQARYQLIFQLFNLNVLPIDTSITPIGINVSKILSYIQ